MLLNVNHLKTYFPVKEGVFGRKIGEVRAVDDVSFMVNDGETFGLVGESGCGKSTLGRTIIRLVEATGGEVWFKNTDITHAGMNQMKTIRKDLQMIFQDPYASLDPRMTVGDLLEEPLIVHHRFNKKERKEWVCQLLQIVGLNGDYIKRYPHEFSGGQRQRIGIARALSLRPKLVIADEPVSALDMSVQSQVLNLMMDLQDQFQLTYLFITHDLSVVLHVSTRIGVMYLGRLVEIATSEELGNHPTHPYTQALFSAIPIPDPKIKREKILLKNEVIQSTPHANGCPFLGRCGVKVARCSVESPVLKEIHNDHFVSCHLY